MVSSGFKETLRFGGERVYGSADVIDSEMGIVQSVTPTETNNLIKVRAMGGTRDFFSIIPGKFEVSGGMEFYLQEGKFLKWAIGEDSHLSTTDSGPTYIYSSPSTSTGTTYYHLLGSATGPDGDSFPSFTLEFADNETSGTSSLKRTYEGCRVDSLTISGEVDTPVTVACDWIAQGVVATSAAAPTSVTAVTKDPFVFYQGNLYMTAAAVKGTQAQPTDDVSRIAELNNFSFTVNNNLEPIWYVSGTTNTYQTKRGLKSLSAKGREYEASLGLHFSDRTKYQRFLGVTGATSAQEDFTKYQVVLDFIRDGKGFGFAASTGTDTDMLRIVLASCIFNDANISGAPEDVVAEDYTLFVRSAKFHILDDLSGTYK